MIFVSALSAMAACTSLQDPGQLLDAYRLAVSAPIESHGIWASRYAYDGSGLQGETQTIVDLNTGRYRKEQEAGIVKEAEGFDGRQAWTRDLSQFVKPQAGGDRVALAINQAYRNANLWWRMDRGGATITAAGCDVVRVIPNGGKPFEVWFDPATHLLARLRERGSFGTMVETTFVDYSNRGGRMVPTRLEITYGGDAASTEGLRLVSAGVQPRLANPFSMPRDQPADWRLPPGGRVTMPFRLINNHIIVDAKIDGRGPFPFLVDTGGHNILTPSTVRALALRAEGSAPSSGAGEKSVTNGYARVRSIDAAGAVVLDTTALTLDFSPPAVEGLQLGGMLGVEFLERFVVRVDYGGRTLTFIEPKRFGAAEQARAGKAIAMTFYDHMPQVRGSLDGRPVRLNIDTGARDEVTFASPFVATNKLRSAYRGGVEAITGWGVGGPSLTFTARAGTLALGPVTVHRPVVGMSSATRGVFSDDSYEGNVGSGLLKRFVTTFDYSRRRIYLDPLPHPDPDTGTFDRSGMWLNVAKAGFEIMAVVPGGPADHAGLKVGDLIFAIGGVPFERSSLSDVRRALRLARPSTPIEVRYRRNSMESTTRLWPRDLIPN